MTAAVREEPSDSAAGHLAPLDGLRGLAALAVLVYHIEDFVPVPGDRLVAGGFLGVDLFFALSGYLITAQLLDHQHRTGRLGLSTYAVKRTARLLPLLCVYLVVAALYELAIGTAASDVGWSSLTSGLFLRGDVVGSVDFQLTLSTGHLWTLAVEAHFYLLVPLLVATVLHRRVPGALGIVALGALVGAVAATRRLQFDDGTHVLELFARTTARIDTLLLGAAAAVLHRRTTGEHHRILDRAGWISAAVLVVATLSMSPVSPWLPQGGFTLIGVAAGALVLAAAHGVGPSRFFEVGVLPAIGRASYGLYLWHFLVILATVRWLGEAPWWLQVGVILAATGALTAASWFTVEASVRASMRAWLGDDAPPVGVPAGARETAETAAESAADEPATGPGRRLAGPVVAPRAARA